MKYCVSLLLSLLFLFDNIYAQPDKEMPERKKAEHKLNISYTPQWFPNYRSVTHRGLDNGGGQVLYPKENMPGHTFGIEYQFTGKKGLILSAGLQRGFQNHEVGIRFNLAFIDESDPILASYYVEENHKARIGYKIVRLMAGYRWEQPFKFLKQTNIECKAGFGLKFYDKRENVSNRWILLKANSSGATLIENGFQYVRWGSNSQSGPDRNYTAELYVGLTRHISYYVLQSVSLGIEATTRFRSVPSGEISEELYLVNDQGIRYKYAIYEYKPKDFALGIRLAIGLGYWK